MSPVEHSTLSAPGRSWRNIRQEVKPLAMSRKGRFRRRLEWLKVTTLCALVATAGWGLYVGIHSWETDRSALTAAVHSVPVKEIVVITEGGVLTPKWVGEVLALPKAASLMALDLSELRDKLLAKGQVRVAVLTRSFPDVLIVTLQERTPVARLQAADNSGRTKQLLVARDGVVYDGVNYDRQVLASLPWLDGVRLVKKGDGYEPIAGMSDVATLLSMADLEAQHLYRSWLIVSLARLETRDEIVVKAQDIPEIIFTRKRDFRRQIAQLDYVVDSVKVMPEPTLLSINLALDGQVPVKMRNTPDELAKLSPADFSIQPSQRKSKRDF